MSLPSAELESQRFELTLAAGKDADELSWFGPWYSHLCPHSSADRSEEQAYMDVAPPLIACVGVCVLETDRHNGEGLEWLLLAVVLHP